MQILLDFPPPDGHYVRLNGLIEPGDGLLEDEEAFRDDFEEFIHVFGFQMPRWK